MLSKLGEGGMGEVYRARDTKLDRDVALKVLPESFASDPDRLMRFEREAKTLASLNHPHIAQIHGFEQSGSASALVMELVEGEDLADRIRRGPIPLDEALPIAKQIAEALEAAHDAGIIHRDLKPANIKVRADGTVKVLDFGLAKALDRLDGDGFSRRQDAEGANALSLQTITSPAVTMHGVILGTAAYMSPEQAKGRVVDRRADIWAFGCVLYEMLSGRRAFDGEDVSDVMVAVLSKSVDTARLPANTPNAIRQLLNRCLDRDPRRRLRDIGEARLVIDGVTSGAATDTERPAAKPWNGMVVAASLITAIAAIGIAAYATRATGGDATRDPWRLSIDLGTEQQINVATNGLLAFDPDGATLVFSAQQGGVRALFRRSLFDGRITRLAGSEAAAAPFFSPDGKWIGFEAGGELRKIPAEGGRALSIAEAQGSGGGAWLANGTIVFTPIYSEGLMRVKDDGSGVERLTTPDRSTGELGHFWPSAVTGDRYVVFTAFRTPVDQSRIGVIDLTTKQVRWLVDGGAFGRYIATGHLLYGKSGRLYVMPFDAATGTTSGAAVQIVDDLYLSQTGGWAAADVSKNGLLVYMSNTVANPTADLVWVDRSGRVTPAASERLGYRSVSLSPDDAQAGVTIGGDSLDLWIYSFQRRTLSRMTSSPATEFQPEWSADGRELIYVRDRPPYELYRMLSSQPDSGKPIFKDPPDADTVSAVVSPDGTHVAYMQRQSATGADLFAATLGDSSPPVAVVATKADEGYPTFSPDGRLIAYSSNQTGRPEIYVQPFPGPGERIQVTSDGGWQPSWARNGELFYWHDDQLHVVATRTRGGTDFGAPQKLFSFPLMTPIEAFRTYAISRDGSRILAIDTPEALRPRRLEVITDFRAALARASR